MEIVNIASTNVLGNARGTAATTTPGPAHVAGDAQPADATGVADKRGQIDSAVKSMQSYAQSVTRNLNFSIDDSTGDVVVKVIDGESGKVVRQIPSEEVLKLAAQLDDMRSLMFEAQA